MTDRPALAAALTVLEQGVPELEPGAVPGLVVRLGALLALAGARLAVGSGNGGSAEAPAEDHLLTAREVARRTTLSPAYVYRHADALPFFARRVGRKVLFSEARLSRWLAKRGP